MPLIEEETGEKLVFVREKEFENELGAYAPTVGFDLEFEAIASSVENGAKEAPVLPFSQADSMNVLKAFHVSAKQYDGKSWTGGQLLKSVIASKYDGKRFCVRVRVAPPEGWPEGSLLVNAGLDSDEIKQMMNVSVSL